MNMAAFFAFAALVVWLRFRLERARQDFEATQALEALLQPEARSPR